MAAPVGVSSMVQINLFKNHSYLTEPSTKKKIIKRNKKKQNKKKQTDTPSKKKKRGKTKTKKKRTKTKN